MIVKTHNIRGKKILAICDKSIIGRRYSSEKVQLDLSSSFYAGREMSEKELVDMIKEVYTINVVGKKSITLLTKLGVVSKKNIGKVKGIPYAYAVLE